MQNFRKLKASELAAWRSDQIKEQGGKCLITGWNLSEKVAADHCHRTGMMRSTLPIWVNSCLGRIENWAGRVGGGVRPVDFLRACAAYIEFWEQNPSYVFHPTYKTPDEMKEAAKLKATAARKKRAAAKKAAQEAI